jgi:hypothetical protein
MIGKAQCELELHFCLGKRLGKRGLRLPSQLLPFTRVQSSLLLELLFKVKGSGRNYSHLVCCPKLLLKGTLIYMSTTICIALPKIG